MRVFSRAFHTSYQYSLAVAFPEVDWYFVRGVWHPNRPKPINVYEDQSRPLEEYDLFLAHDPQEYTDLRRQLASLRISPRRLIYISHWAYNPEAWVHQASNKPLEQFRHEVADSPIVAVSHFLIHDFSFYSHVAAEAIPHYVPTHFYKDVKWIGGGGYYMNVVNSFFAPLRGTGAEFWLNLPDVPKRLYGNGNGERGVGGLNTVNELAEAAIHARAYLWTGEAMSFAPLEAVACGCPLIAPDNTDWAKMFVPDKDILLYQEGDRDSLLTVLRRLENEPDLSRRLSECGRQTVAERFGIGQFRAKWDRVLSGALGTW